MKIANINVGAATMTTEILGPIPSGLVGGTVMLEYTDPIWDGLTKTAVFRGAAVKDVLNADGEIRIPWETVKRPGFFLWLGVYGTNADGSLVVPTVWAQLGPVVPGAAPSGDGSGDPSLAVWAQLLAMMGDPRQLETEAKDNLVAAINEALHSAGGTGSANAYTLLGQTPQRVSTGGTVKLTAAGACSYTVQSDTVAQMDPGTAAPVRASLQQMDGYYQLQADSDAVNWYQSYVDLTAEGLTVGESYNFIFDAADVPYDAANHIAVGHFILYDGNDNTLVTRDALKGAVLHSYAFTATTQNVRLRWYPAPSTEFVAGASAANARAMYLNRAGTTAQTAIMVLSGSFSDSLVLQDLPGGVTVAAEPEAAVYLRTGVESAAQTRLSGRKCICFGDSVTGNMDAPYDYPTVISEETGMTVINAGFGGCRMSDTHPTACYAAFSMVKLADAAVSGDWSLQDGLVGEMSEATNAAQHLSDLKEVDWADVDIVTIAYGTNDINGAVPVDDAEEPVNTATYLGALRYAVEVLLKAYPHLRLMLLTPIYRYWPEEGLDSDEKLFDGQKFTAWGDGLLEMAGQYKLPAVDLYRTLGFNALTREYFFPANDGTHPNAEGLRRMGEKIAANLLAQY